MNYSEHKYHTSLNTLPIVQWGLLNESIQAEKPIWEYLLVLDRNLELPKINNEFRVKLFETYNELRYQIKTIDLSLQSYWKEFLHSYVTLQLKTNQNSIKKLSGIEMLKRFRPNYEKNNNAFFDLSAYLDENYKSFTVSKFHIKKDPEKAYFKHYKQKPVKSMMKLFDKAAFFVTTFQLYEVSKEINKDPVFIRFVNDEHFVNAMYDIVDHKINSITFYNEFIKEQYIKYDQYHNYIITRPNIFNLDNMKCEPLHKYSFYEELTRYITYTNINIDEFTTSVSKFSNLVDIAKKDSEERKKNKPNSGKEKLSNR